MSTSWQKIQSLKKSWLQKLQIKKFFCAVFHFCMKNMCTQLFDAIMRGFCVIF